jgi:ABC-type branched-subunit amino acid transport system permease subunit
MSLPAPRSLSEVVPMPVFFARDFSQVIGMTLETAPTIDYLLHCGRAAIMGGIYLLLNSALGLGMLSVRDDEVIAARIGVNVWRNRFIAAVAAGWVWPVRS